MGGTVLVNYPKEARVRCVAAGRRHNHIGTVVDSLIGQDGEVRLYLVRFDEMIEYENVEPAVPKELRMLLSNRGEED